MEYSISEKCNQLTIREIKDIIKSNNINITSKYNTKQKLCNFMVNNYSNLIQYAWINKFSIPMYQKSFSNSSQFSNFKLTNYNQQNEFQKQSTQEIIFNNPPRMLDLPDEMLLEVLYAMNTNQIISFCVSNKRINSICNDDNFWKYKFIRDYGYINYTGNWKKLYINFNNVWVLKYESIVCGSAKTVKVKIEGLITGSIQQSTEEALFTSLNKKALQVSLGFDYLLLLDLNHNVWLRSGINATENLCEEFTQIPNIKAKKISCGAHHALILDQYNDLYVFGSNRFGELGLNLQPTFYTSNPTKISTFKVKDIAAGFRHNIIIDSNDDVYTFGLGEYGRLGLDVKNAFVPTKIQNIKGKSVYADRYKSAIIDLDNNVWIFGDNRYGSLGTGDKISRWKPFKIPNLKAKQISLGLSHTLIIDLNNNVWSFGYNRNGQLGFADQIEIYIPTQIPNIKAKQVLVYRDSTLIIDLNYNIWTFGNAHLNNYMLHTFNSYPMLKLNGIKAFKVYTSTDGSVANTLIIIGDIDT